MSITLIRHGESDMNLENRFGGWMDCELTANAFLDMDRSAKLIKEHFGESFEYDLCYTSVLKRSIKSANYLLEKLDCLHIEHKKTWLFNERHYGALTGVNRLDAVKTYGKDQMKIWRRSYDVRPPEMVDDLYHINSDRRYKKSKTKIPLTESLKDVEIRITDLWKNHILPKQIMAKKLNILCLIHGTSARGLTIAIENVEKPGTGELVSKLEVPNGYPLIYTFNTDTGDIIKPKKLLDFMPIHGQFLGDPSELEKAQEKVRQQMEEKKTPESTAK